MLDPLITDPSPSTSQINITPPKMTLLTPKTPKLLPHQTLIKGCHFLTPYSNPYYNISLCGVSYRSSTMNRNCKHRRKWVGKLESIVLIKVTLPTLDKIPFLHDRLAQCAFFNKFTTCKSKNSKIKFNIIKKNLDYYSKSHKKPHIPPRLNVLDPNYFSQEGKKIRMSQIQPYKYG